MRRIESYMSRPVHLIEKSSSLAEARERMVAEQVRHLIVVDRGRPIGLLSERDIFRWEAGKPVDPEVMSVTEAMAPDVYMVTPETPLAEVALGMASRRIGAAVVALDGEPIGVFTTTDALRVLGALAK